MKIVIGCDVDPILPPLLSHPLNNDIWKCLDHLNCLLDVAKGSLPPITWLIRSDASVRFATGDFASGYTTRRKLWETLVADGHELGWHMHLMSFDNRFGDFEFDPDPEWLSDAYRALSAYYNVQSTRTGWDYANNALFQKFEALGILVDFSALPGNLSWLPVGQQTLFVDWSHCPEEPYHPSPADYQRPGNLNLLEIPITQFPNSIVGMARRVAMRVKNRCFAMSGMRNKTKTVASRWHVAPRSNSAVWAFYFHPEDLTRRGLSNFLSNLDYLRSLGDAEFVTASAAWRFLMEIGRPTAPPLGQI
jgi:hypothetical protein